MIDDKTAQDMLKSIITSGAASEENKTIQVILASRSNLSAIIDISSGLPKIRLNVRDKFKLVLSQPIILQAFNPFEIRCCLCNKVITYPAWYLCLRYMVNEFHYFICFDNANSNKPTAKCFR